ncbi:hypothetical protein NESM_000440400 [Novymonas esmeraldas]|uniref:Uncharacterized protein n=1 Tax=Novymonas esmeraldas TaxID=1808958 RepID=A0AAW0EPN9_9TRYP
MAANYNDLLHRELHAQQPQPQPPQAHHADDVGGGTAAWPAPSPSLAPPAMAHSGASWPLSSTVGAEAGVVAALPGSMEGPLPPDVRRIIAQSCSGGAAEASAVVDATEQQARRLISTGRRVKVYREELAAAEEERRDLSAAAEQHELVRAVLQGEVVDLNGRIQALLQERALVETQLLAQDDAASRVTRQLAEAQERVSVLRHTIDGIVEETTVARLMLRQQVPSLHIENYY